MFSHRLTMNYCCTTIMPSLARTLVAHSVLSVLCASFFSATIPIRFPFHHQLKSKQDIMPKHKSDVFAELSWATKTSMSESTICPGRIVAIRREGWIVYRHRLG
ncbi:hypothetical protein K504DRAFT_127615 [Pleomassaria siparia CBS 279.74]|uniref:Uncharacterized protein n=1 Tax=Pleomassaria siparia CBS 279.74 TaxID=1314801 RepID=A0A6G1KJG7_9PLEO|nr:hypothetical protein K504DRAFT_127615 [Pleomassaria siparia CBS 279.74]